MRVANADPEWYARSFTKRQWAKMGYLPKSDASGEDCWTNGNYKMTAVYYRDDEVEEASPEALEEYFRPIREHRNALQRKRRAEKRRLKEAARRRKEAMQQHYRDTINLPAVPHDPIDMIVFDVETTGLNPEMNEIIQISIIDGDGNTLLNSYVHPYVEERWPEARAVNGIYPYMVKDAPYPHELIPIVKGIFDAAGTIVAYNNEFDLKFLWLWGIRVGDKPQVDVMREFSVVYGDWDDEFMDYRWQKLKTAARYYGYKYKAHDSLEDVRATLYVYRKMQGEQSEDSGREPGACSAV